MHPKASGAISARANSTEPAHYRCDQCGENTQGFWGLLWHGRVSGHRPFACEVEDCRELFRTPEESAAHRRSVHIRGEHERLAGPGPNACLECHAVFPNVSQLRLHANEAQHSPFGCSCGKTFARLDVLNRHHDSLGVGTPKYPCSYCKRHRGKNGFRRRDHLLQHIRGYHKFEAEDKVGQINNFRNCSSAKVHVCPHANCPHHRGKSFWELPRTEQLRQKPFEKQSEYTKHLKEVHQETPFPCTITGCDRSGPKGYVNEKALITHRKEKHPEAAPYVAEARDIRVECPNPGCIRRYNPGNLNWHILFKHRTQEERLASYQ
jgi:hypothetical protein